MDLVKELKDFTETTIVGLCIEIPLIVLYAVEIYISVCVNPAVDGLSMALYVACLTPINGVLVYYLGKPLCKFLEWHVLSK